MGRVNAERRHAGIFNIEKSIICGCKYLETSIFVGGFKLIVPFLLDGREIKENQSARVSSPRIRSKKLDLENSWKPKMGMKNKFGVS